MSLSVNKSEFDKAIALIEDFKVKIKLDQSKPDDLKTLKILQCRENNHKFEYDLAVMICGDENSSFPYRSSTKITDFFQRLSLNYVHDGSTRRFWVEDTLKQLGIRDIERIIKRGLFSKRDFKDFCLEKNLNHNEQFSKAILEFQQFINDSLLENEEMDLAFLLNMNVNTELLFNQNPVTNDKELNNLIIEAKERFLNPKDKQIDLEKIWDAFERIKTYYGENKKTSINKLIDNISSDLKKDIFNDEFNSLTTIGNIYRIRHHEKGKFEINDQKQIDYLFFRVLSLIDLCIEKIKQEST